TRAVRYLPKRSEAAQQLILTHKRHGSTVSQVLEQKLKENASAFLNGEIDGTSLLAMAFARTHLQRPSGSDSQDAQTAKLNELRKVVIDLHAKVDSRGSNAPRKKTKPKLRKREAVVLAAIIRGLKGEKYCAYLDSHGIRPTWDAGESPTSYSRAYVIGQ